ncbi:MAG: CBS domain-containing protein [Firmicutes bacterium]|nr:CBS domain-containing protein [Bacillota bacterium]
MYNLYVGEGGYLVVQVITTHVNTDFDGLGAMLAAAQLYPKAALYFSGQLSRPVREFYSLYRDSLPIRAPEMLNLGTVSELIIVDTQQAKRLGRFKALLERPDVQVTIFDHHPPPREPITRAKLHHAKVGAITSFLVNRMAAQNLVPNQLEATVMALGIYADTSSLTAPTTTLQDVDAIRFLLEAGADLEVIHRYLHSPLTQNHRLLLEEMLANSERFYHHGVSILITLCSIDYYLDGLGLLSERLAAIEGADLVFCLVEMDGRVHLTARSRLNHLPVNEIVAHFGGSGHPLAAAATIKGRSLLELKQQLVSYLATRLSPPLTAADIMSQPIHSTVPDTSMEEVGQAMLRYGHGGLPVIADGQLVGIISRRDVDKAIHHGLTHAPVKGFMSTNVVTISPTASLDEIQRLLVGKDIGRLPVVDQEGKLIGIVTRTDVLKALHGRSYPHWYQMNGRATVDEPSRSTMLANLMTERLPKKLQGLLLLIGKQAARHQVRAYLVGGIVRDLLLNVPNHDIDIVVEPSAIEFAEQLAKVFGGSVQTYPQFGTATIKRPDGVTVDLVTARSEFYVSPAAMPTVEQANLKQDLYRRDFTINTVAIALHGTDYGRFYDFFGGRADLEAGIVRVLYNLSFVDDPTRILRAIRFEQRYGFKIEPETMGFLRNALEHNLLKEVSGERIKDELVQSLSEDKAPHIILRMDELGIWPTLLPGLELSDTLIAHLRDAQDHIQWFEDLQTDTTLERWLVYLLLLSTGVTTEQLHLWPERLALTKREREMLLSFSATQAGLATGLTEASRGEEVFQLLEGQPAECQVAMAVLQGRAVRKQLAEYWKHLVNVHPEVNGHDLLSIGLKPGPQVGEILRKIHMARLNGQVVNKEQELELARQLLLTPEEGR